MHFRYWQKWLRGWGILIEFIASMFFGYLMIFVALLPASVLSSIGEASRNSLGDTWAIVLLVVAIGYALLLAPIVLFYLIRIFGYPWGWVKDNTQAE
jgi:hypothetical protein